MEAAVVLALSLRSFVQVEVAIHGELERKAIRKMILIF
jgi:hypothetical protein